MVEHQRGVNRHELRQTGIEHRLHPVRADRVAGFHRRFIHALHLLGEELAQHADLVHADGQHARKRARPDHLDENDRVHQLRERAQHVEHKFAHARHDRVFPQAAGSQKRKRNGQNRADGRAKETNAHRQQHQVEDILRAPGIKRGEIRLAEVGDCRPERAPRKIIQRAPVDIRRTPNQQRSRRGGNRPFFDRIRKPHLHFSLLRIASESASTNTTTAKINRMMIDTRSYLNSPSASLSFTPMPPAPTYPNTVEARTFSSNA